MATIKLSATAPIVRTLSTCLSTSDQTLLRTTTRFGFFGTCSQASRTPPPSHIFLSKSTQCSSRSSNSSSFIYSSLLNFESHITKWNLAPNFLYSIVTGMNIQARHFSSDAKGIQSQISSLQAKKRAVRKRVTKPDASAIQDQVSSLSNGGILFNQDTGTVIAYATAEEFNLEALNMALQKLGHYQPSSMPEDVHDVLHVSAKYQAAREPKEIYFFREGSIVFWNVPDAERETIIDFVPAFEENSYNRNLVLDENEIIEYTYTDNKTRLVNGRILLNSEGSTDLEKYTFSNAMALSVKLALWEASLDQYVDSIEYVTEDMRCGKPITMSRQQVLQKMGELFALKHLINLSSDLLDTPDFYWDRQTLESLYHKTCNHLNISKRTRVMNEKLNHCKELIQLLSDHLNDRHHVRLEVMIIALIMVEVAFELMHFFQRLFDNETSTVSSSAGQAVIQSQTAQ